MNAKEARNKADNYIKSPLEKVMDKIEKAANKGKFYIQIPVIDSNTIDSLAELGYEIIPVSTGGNQWNPEYQYRILW